MSPPPPPIADPLPPPMARQLTLPLPATGMTTTGPPAAERPIPPREVWAGLTLAARQALRRTMLRVAQEVRHDVDRA